MKSMTGYGMGEFKWKNGKITFEVKSVNHRFCEVNLRLPNRFYPLEAALIEFSRNSFSRGRIDIFIRESGGRRRGKVRVDQEQLDQYLQVLKKMQTDQIRSLDVKKRMQDAFNDYTQNIHQDLVWTGACNSWCKSGIPTIASRRAIPRRP